MVAAALTAALAGRADFEVARGAVSVTASALEEYDSNIFANADQQSDWHTVLTPGATFVRNVGLIMTDLKGGVKFQRFADHTSADSNDPFGSAELRWDQGEGKTMGDLNISYQKISDANYEVNTRTEANDFETSLDFGSYPVEKFGFKIRGDYLDRNYLDWGLSDFHREQIETDLRYQYSPKGEAFIGAVGQLNNTYNIPPMLPTMDSDDLKYEFGVDGEVLPKLTGSFATGWVTRHFRSRAGGRRSGILFASSLQWHPDDESQVSFIANRDFDTTAIDQSVLQLTLGVELRREVLSKANVTVGVYHFDGNYIGIPATVDRKDNGFSGRVGIEYSLTTHWKAEAHLSYNNTRSTLQFSQYDRTIVGVGLEAMF